MIQKNSYTINLGKRLQETRETNKLSQELISKLLGIPRTRYYNYEQGNGQMDYEKIIAFCEINGVSINFIIKGTKEIQIYNKELVAQTIALKKIKKIIDTL